MAAPRKVNGKWLARVRRTGYPEQSKVFSTRVLAEKWQRQIEGDIELGRSGIYVPSSLRLSQLIQRYSDEIGSVKPFGKNKASVLQLISADLGGEKVGDLTAERIVHYITHQRRIEGVTANIDLTYLKGVLKVARALWRINVSPGVVDEAREMLRYMGVSYRGAERDRRPSSSEIEMLRQWFRKGKTLHTDHIDFILASCFRPPSEVVRLKWDLLNHADRTIWIEDRKDPRRKLGNNQLVPLLGESYEIVARQPKTGEFIFPVNGDSWSSLFPRACKALGIHDLRLYDLRHEAISRLVESGKYSIPEMMLVTGHKDPKQLMRYTQLRAKDLHR